MTKPVHFYEKFNISYLECHSILCDKAGYEFHHEYYNTNVKLYNEYDNFHNPILKLYRIDSSTTAGDVYIKSYKYSVLATADKNKITCPKCKDLFMIKDIIE